MNRIPTASSAAASLLQTIGAALSPHGLILRGGFNFGAHDIPPDGPDGGPAGSVLLVGHGGGTIWEPFERWRDLQPEGMAHPLDGWSKQVLESVARDCDARAVFPSDPPYLPFQRWAMRAEGLRPSPLGVLMHPVFGPWHGYRGALLFSQALAISPAGTVSHACDSCAAKPCLATCPVAAYSPQGFEVDTCRSHVRGASGGLCRNSGCLARNACPVGRDHRYSGVQQRFHQAAFLG
ncbi:hypothetical protein [Zhengella mangrovi]|uniref:hypothetical protein n=1 Tax=Zhengella mangrovi TaxID=1982044 RepID=UPI001FE06294|nr:hypothetical protein [Zhengella mangrovi]